MTNPSLNLTQEEYIRLMKEANFRFEALVKKTHQDMLAAGWTPISVNHDELVYAKQACNTGRLTEVIIPRPAAQEKDKLNVIREALWEVFPNASIQMSSERYQEGKGSGIVAQIDGDFTFHFEDMAKLAAIFGTDRLDFRQTAAEAGYRYSSVTWDDGTSQKLFIDAYYEEV